MGNSAVPSSQPSNDYQIDATSSDVDLNRALEALWAAHTNTANARAQSTKWLSALKDSLQPYIGRWIIATRVVSDSSGNPADRLLGRLVSARFEDLNFTIRVTDWERPVTRPGTLYRFMSGAQVRVVRGLGTETISTPLPEVDTCIEETLLSLTHHEIRNSTRRQASASVMEMLEDRLNRPLRISGIRATQQGDRRWRVSDPNETSAIHGRLLGVCPDRVSGLAQPDEAIHISVAGLTDDSEIHLCLVRGSTVEEITAISCE